eukprot:s2250_g2.t1
MASSKGDSHHRKLCVFMAAVEENPKEFSEFIDRKRTLTELRIAHKDSSDSSRSGASSKSSASTGEREHRRHIIQL